MNPSAVLRRTPEDFVVEEIPAYAPSGLGEHLFVLVRKRNCTTLDAVRRVCDVLGADARQAGFAGMKDKRAVTTQTLSIPFPIARALPTVDALRSDGIDVLEIARHGNKLKPGHLKGNRFSIVLRNLPPEKMDEVAQALMALGQSGAPNGFGPQRFGRFGDNAERAIACLSGKMPTPRDRRQMRLLFSALQSQLFNEVLELRARDGTHCVPVLGDLLKKHDTGGLFLCADPATDGERARARELSPTGPIFGASMRWPEGRPGEIEREVLGRAGGMDLFERHRALGEGSRRSLRLFAEDLRAERISDDPTALRVGFVLPKGGYATTLLACVVQLSEETTSDEEMVGE